MNALEIDRATTGYTKAAILHEISFTVAEGEFVGVLGANGAGKSTLLRLIAGELSTRAGSVRLFGKPLTGSTWNRVARGVALVPEGRHIFGAMSVRDNLEVAGLVRRSRPGALDRVYALFPRLADRRDQKAGSMSGGEQQMLAIGRALMTDPRLLLVDEMTAGLSPVMAQHLVDSLGVIHEQGVSVVVVEQSPELLDGVVDRVYVLANGAVDRTGTLAEVGGVDVLADLYLGIE